MFRFFAVLSLLALGLSGLRGDDLPGLKEPLRSVTVAYLTIQQQLSTDSFAAVPAAAAEMKAKIAGAPDLFAPDFVAAVDKLADAKDLHSARLAFPEVSDCFIAALARAKAETGALHTAYCPMRKAFWVQRDGKTIANPYYGAGMPDCGEFQKLY